MAGIDGLAGLAAKVRVERQRLLDRLKAFEIKLVETSAGLGCFGHSETVALQHWGREGSGKSARRDGWLFFDGTKLTVGTELSREGRSDTEWQDYEIDEIWPEWQMLLSKPEVLESLIEDIWQGLERDHTTISTTNEWLTKFVTVEKAVIDADVEAQLEQHPSLLESWQKARKAVEVDPEDSIARSSSHAETVFKRCLKELGDTGHETLTMQALISRTSKKLHEARYLDEGAKQSLIGIGTIFHGIGTLRNSSSTAHGKNDGYTPPDPDLAQLINHLSGAASAFVLKQTEKVLKGEQQSE